MIILYANPNIYQLVP